MTITETLDLTAFNALSPAAAERTLLRCCSAIRWARRVAAGRPYHNVGALSAAADTALSALTEQDLDLAMAGHPRIGAQAAGESQREQAAMQGSSIRTASALTAGNAEYEARFGHVYLVCADGRSGDELLSSLTRRLRNDPATERAQVRAELGKINRIRLQRLIGAEIPA